jgi:hypothetical protein
MFSPPYPRNAVVKKEKVPHRELNPGHPAQSQFLYVLKLYKLNYRSQGSSVSIVSDYRLEDRGSIPAEAKDFSSSLCVQTSSEAHPAAYPMGTGGSLAGVQRGRGVMLTTHPSLVPRSRMSGIYTSSPPYRLHGEYGDSFYKLKYIQT